MQKRKNHIDRRDFIKTLGAAGLGSVLASAELTAKTADANAPSETTEPKLPQVPRRKLGKTGVDVPCLSLGSSGTEDTAVLRKALDWGINYWDTSYVAAGGNSELGIGRFLSKNPDVRKKLFIVTKESESKTAEDLERCLQTSLKRMNTKYVDLYFGVYRMSEPSALTDEVRKWAESAKKRKLIRFFGFSTHKEIGDCLKAAAKAGWVDAIMLAYNFRLMQDSELQEAVQACYEAGVGLVAMKTQAHGQKINTEEDKKLVGHFLKQGFTEGQAKIKAVLEDKRLSSACVSIPDIAVLTENAAAALDKTKLSRADMKVFAEYARATCSGYCAGCAHICNLALPNMPYVSDIMRYLMYYNSYGERDGARKLFAQIPESVRRRLLSVDYSTAEARCPQRLPIRKLMAKAVSKLA